MKYMNEPIRVAQIVGKMVNGGVEAVVMNYYRNIDKSKVQFDFYIDADSTVDRSDEIKSLGGRVFIVPPYQDIFRYISALIKLFRENKYTIVHSHLNTLSVFSLFAAWLARVPVRIAHNHSTAAKGEGKKNILKYLLRPFSKVFATDYAACSYIAGEWLFGKRSMLHGDVTIFNNAINLEKFRYAEDLRREVRTELGLESKFVIGHVGRFCYQKNQDFLIDVFDKVFRQQPNAVLLLVGDGPDRERIEKRTVGKPVIFLGNRKDVERLFQAMDVFVFPSRYEGLGMAAVEAQACGIHTIVSREIPKEAVVSDNIEYLELSDGASVWASEVLRCTRHTRHIQPNIPKQYDISVQANKLAEYYVIQICKIK